MLKYIIGIALLKTYSFSFFRYGIAGSLSICTVAPGAGYSVGFGNSVTEIGSVPRDLPKTLDITTIQSASPTVTERYMNPKVIACDAAWAVAATATPV
jgi:hypothetical protein